MERIYCGDLMGSVYIVQLTTSLFMSGLIWLVQLVHYPAFRYVNSEKFVDFEKFHTSKISLIVVPIMIIELVSGVMLYWYYKSDFFTLILILIALIWLVTMIFSIPSHQVLSERKCEKAINRLIITNWLRTWLWSVKSVILIVWIDKFF